MNTQEPDRSSAVDWAREHGEAFSWYCALDDHEPVARNHASGRCYRYSTDTVTDALIIDGAMVFRNGSKSVYLIDDGASVRPYYVAAYHPEHNHVIAHPFPTDVDADGNPRLRADNGRPVDFTYWMFGPSRAYHLKVRKVES